MNLTKLSERLSELMFEAHLNGHTLHEKLGCGYNTIYRYLQGTHIPTVDMVVALADYFNCSTDFLLGLEEENVYNKFKTCLPFAQRFPALLKECKISQYRLEKLTGISHSAMGYWKSGKKQPTIESIIKIAEILKCRVDFVLGREV